MNRRREEQLRMLAEEDPDVLVDILRISSLELLRRFPRKVSAYISEQVGEEYDGDDEEENY